ncbi:MAG: leucine-rich repeat protein [Lachnospiraceae bacterium]|nr:leucine-rich repeat protein [Lachnospiraceae bacterium]
MKRKGKIFSLILCGTMLLSLCSPSDSYARESPQDGRQTAPKAAEIDSGNFTNNKDWRWTVDDSGTLTITGTGAMPAYSTAWIPWRKHIGSIKKAVIENGVTSIADRAFWQHGGLTSVELPESVSSIKKNAFYHCGELSFVNLPGVKSIGDGAFSGCGKLALTSLPEGITSIGNLTFSGCANLRLTELPADITFIGNGAFKDCTSLALTSLPEGITSIGAQVFLNCTSLKGMEFSGSLNSIGHSAFYGCTSLEKLDLPAGLNSIQDFAFYGCTSLNEVTFTSGAAPELGSDVFGNCDALTAIHVPEGATGYDGTNWPVDKIIQPVSYSVTILAGEGGTASASHSLAKEGMEVTLTAVPDGGYHFKEWQAISGGAIISGSNFVMPASNVTLKAVFEKDSAPMPVVPQEPETETQEPEQTIINLNSGNVKLSKTRVTYNGKAQKPAVAVKDNQGKKISSQNYTVKYKDNKKIGQASVTVAFNGNYRGTVKKTFQIVPKGTSISRLKAGKRGFSVKWNKQKKEISGYEIQYSTSKKFKGAKKIRNIKVQTTSKNISKLKAKKKYYVRIRTFKKVKGKKYYSEWSKAKSVLTKK